MKKDIINKILRSLGNYLIFFLLTAFIVTCCMMVFLNALSDSVDIAMTEENIQTAAKLTFGNILLLTFAFTVIDGVRRKMTVERPVKRITAAAEKITQGDFSVRIPRTSLLAAESTFNQIADCFNKMAEELNGMETLRNDFVANVSHEIKTPLSVIQNYATMLSQKGLTEKQTEEYARAIAEATRRLSDLVSNILKLSKLDNQQIFPQTSVYDLGEQLCECLLGFEDLWEKKDIEISTDIADNVMVRADREIMSVVWNNLVSNAIKFTDRGGDIFLSLRTEKGLAVITVEDTGCGISKEVGKHIFDKFYQGDNSHAAQGNGLGLALVKRIMDITGSEISVVSEVGKGSAFTVKMPRRVDGED